ncbi:MAG: hypothetical protein EXR77_05875 [Myxococcales bacterium]|nr:hypothetical protein [Myxococcales bacterium]
MVAITAACVGGGEAADAGAAAAADSAGATDVNVADGASPADTVGVDTAVTGTDAASTGDSTPQDDSDAVAPSDTLTTGDTPTTGDTAVTPDVQSGCKEDKDCPAPAAACTVSTCNVATGKCAEKPAADASSCDDSNACTEKDECVAGKCTGATKDCKDKNECTDDSCEATKGCVNAVNTVQCSDNDICTLADACKDGKCVPGATDKCDDGNPCTDDGCGITEVVKGTKGCTHTNSIAACEDGSACTKGDLCAAGLCAAGTPTVCDDKNACTVDTCDTKTGCVQTPAPDASTCDDGNACTTTDSCAAGKCEGKAVVCDDKNACTKDSCDIAAGCTATNDNTAACDDDNSCSISDKCSAGTCKGIGKVCAEDGNPCTNEECANNVCSAVANADPCDDGNPCSQKDVCKDKQCGGGEAIKCDDKNDCTDDLCDKATGICKFTNNTTTCSDDSACTSKDGCQGGVCVGTPIPCDDGNQCTLDACDDATGKCASAALADDTLCDDGTVCSQKDACKAGKCGGVSINCDDGNPCTDDVCDVAKGCTNNANTAKCEDGSKCTVGDLCKDKLCQPSAIVDKCEDGTVCTKDSCDAGAGCVHENVAANCDDKNPCTETDICTAGTCAGTKPKVCDDNNLCTDDSCDKTKGCVAVNNTAGCTDNNVCTTSDACAVGACKGKPTLNCDDKNVCTIDTCDDKTGCAYKPAAAGGVCDDGNTCTNTDKCDSAGKCAGIGKNCDDNNPCTTDSCKDNVCSTANNTNPCADGDACTLNDTCNGVGACKGAADLNCNDNNVCTTDSCDKIAGCKVVNNTAVCDDGKFCSETDACNLGKCEVAKARNCDDANLCTNDSCDDANKKCASLANAAACDDGAKCTGPDVCKDSKCAAGPVKKCDDGNPCTIDSCDATTAACKVVLTTDIVVCPVYPLPANFNIDFGDAAWVNVGGSAGVKWGTDASPAAPGKLTGAASLNVNNGTGYADGTHIIADGLGKFFVNASAYTGAKMTLAFYSWLDVQEPTMDRCWVELSSDGFVTKISQQLPSVKAWTLNAMDLTSMIGKKFQIRFHFDTLDGIGNAGVGAFVDQITVYGGPIVAITPSSWWTEPFENNSFGWQFSAPNTSGTGFAIDSTPDVTTVNTTVASKISLNMNNGINFSGLTQANAMAPVIDLTNAGAGPVTLLFKEYVDTEFGGSYDARYVQVTGDAFVTMPISSTLNASVQHGKGWRWSWVDLTGVKGKKVQLRFRFDSVDSTANEGKGWFIEDLSLDTIAAPSYAEMVTCGNASAFTIANANAIGWGVDANAGAAFFSGDCSLNFSSLVATAYNFTCPASTTKVAGTAKTAVFNVKASAAVGAVTWLRFKSLVDAETGSYDKFTVIVKEIGGGALTKEYVVNKISAYKKWADVAFDITVFNGKNVVLVFNFDSLDCSVNSGAGIFVDDIMVRPDK